MAKMNIRDGSGDRDFFTLVPNYILNHSTGITQALYLQMKRYAGEEGKCFATEQTLMKKIGVGKKAFNTSLAYLIDHKWIDFIGTTESKTRPIKTYKINNIWQQNSDYYREISSESNVSFSRDKFQKEGDKFQKHTKISSESTIEEEPYKQEPLRKSIIAKNEFSPDIPKLIKCFEVVNPSISKLYGNKTQRSACERLLKKWSLEELKSLIENVLPKLNSSQYAKGKSITPLQFEDNLGYIKAFIDKKNNQGVLSIQ